MAGLDQERHDRADDEDRLEPFPQDDQEGLQERTPPAARWLGELHDLREAQLNGVARSVGNAKIADLDGSLEVGELSLERGNESRVLGPGGRFQRLEGDVRIECAVPGVVHPSAPSVYQCLVDERHDVRSHARRAGAIDGGRRGRRHRRASLARLAGQ